MTRRSIVAAVAAVVILAGCGAQADTPGTGARRRAPQRITSSIAEGAQLTAPVVWQARIAGIPAARIVEVRFLIDGRLAHTERRAPYMFAGDGNRLLPGALGPGSHTFAVVAQTDSGRQLTAATTATVATHTPAVPAALQGAWTRSVTRADVRRTKGFRTLGPGEIALPAGTWRMRIGADGVARYTDPTPTHDETVDQLRFGPRHTLVVGNVIPNFPNVSEGGFCPDPVTSGRYSWALRGRTLVVRLVGDRGCADRNSFWAGRFTR
jgi:hypothetical protein